QLALLRPKTGAVLEQVLLQDGAAETRRDPVMHHPVDQWGGLVVLGRAVAEKLLLRHTDVAFGGRFREEFAQPVAQLLVFAGYGRRRTLGPLIGIEMALLVFLAATAPAWVVAAGRGPTQHLLRWQREILLVFFVLPNSLTAADVVHRPWGVLRGQRRRGTTNANLNQVVALPATLARQPGGVSPHHRTGSFDARAAARRDHGAHQRREKGAEILVRNVVEILAQPRQQFAGGVQPRMAEHSLQHRHPLARAQSGSDFAERARSLLEIAVNDAIQRPTRGAGQIHIVQEGELQQMRDRAGVTDLTQQGERVLGDIHVVLGQETLGPTTQHSNQERDERLSLLDQRVDQLRIQVFAVLQLMDEPVRPQAGGHGRGFQVPPPAQCFGHQFDLLNLAQVLISLDVVQAEWNRARPQGLEIFLVEQQL